jgi:hypothetical protein
MTDTKARWLDWAREIQALAQTGRHYSANHFQARRYARLTAIAAEIVAEHSQLPAPAVQRVFERQNGYATPRVDVRAAVFREGRLLLVRGCEPMELFHAFKIVFLCHLEGGEATPSEETTEVAFFGPDQMPADFSGERTRPRHVQDAFAALADRGRPTVFD